MRLSSKLILGVAIFATNAYATCFTHGESFGDYVDFAIDKTKDACTHILGQGGVFNFAEARTYPTVNLII